MRKACLTRFLSDSGIPPSRGQRTFAHYLSIGSQGDGFQTLWRAGSPETAAQHWVTLRLAMRAVVQRVSRAEVRVERKVVGRIGPGLVVLVAVGAGDSPEAGRALAEKIVHLRIFDNDARRMDRSLLDAGGGILCVSQFTLYGDSHKGRRPSYDRAAPPAVAQPLYESFLAALRAFGVQVETGQFQAQMEVELANDGPVTLLLDSEKVF